MNTLGLMLLQTSSSQASILGGVTVRHVMTAIVVLAAAAVLIRLLARSLARLGRRSARARFVAKWIEPVARIFIWLGALLIAIRLLAPSRDAFVASIASVGIAIGLGAQDLVKNFIGGFVVLSDRPYQLGDRVQIGDASGEIVHIGLRSTKLYTFGDTLVTVPNAQILNDRVFNSNTGVPECLVVTDLYLAPDTPPEEASAVCREAALCSPFTLVRKPVVALTTYGYDRRPYLHVQVKAYVYDHRMQPQMQSDITGRASRELKKRAMLWGWEGNAAPEAQ